MAASQMGAEILEVNTREVDSAVLAFVSEAVIDPVSTVEGAIESVEFVRADAKSRACLRYYSHP